MADPVQAITSKIKGSTARELTESIEALIEHGELRPGDTLPSVRGLASDRGVSPMTVVAAYRDLRQRGIVTTHERRRTRVSARPPIASRAALPLGSDTRDLSSDNPDPAFLPDLRPILAEIETPAHLYGEAPVLSALEELARAELESLGLPPGEIAVANGTFDAIERILETHLKSGDLVAVEDPGYTGVLDLVRAVGLEPAGVLCDELGLVPEALEEVLGRGARAVVVTPRAQNPRGAAFSEARASELRAILERWPDVWLIEDDHAGPITDLPYFSLVGERSRWSVIRSVSKFFGPDLRLAVVVGDSRTISQLQGRQLLASGWVSYLVQRVVVALWKAPETERLLADAADAYTSRRQAVIDALAARGIQAFGRTGLNIWLPVTEEGTAMRNLMQLGWAVTAGDIFRLGSPPGLRITTAALPEKDAEPLADDITRALNPVPRTGRN